MKPLRLAAACSLALVLGVPLSQGSDYCREVRKSRNAESDPTESVAVATQGPGTIASDDGTSASVAPIESGSPLADAARAARPGPQAVSSAGGSPSTGVGLVAQARGGTMSSPRLRADRRIRSVIRRLH